VVTRRTLGGESPADVPKPLPAFGEAESGTPPLAELDRRRAAERKAAWAAKREVLMAAGVAMLRAVERGELDPRSIDSDPPGWSTRRPVPAVEPEDRGGLDWALWNAARSPQSREDFEREVAAVKADHWRRLSTGPECRVVAVSAPAPRAAVAVLRPLRADRTRRESPARTVGRGGDSGDSSDSSDSDGGSDPPGVARAFSRPRADALRHVSVALDSFVEDALPEPYTFAEHRRRYGHLPPGDQLAAFLTLPEWQCQQAWRSLRLDIDRERGPPAVASARP
jgi:hypothetical protein